MNQRSALDRAVADATIALEATIERLRLAIRSREGLVVQFDAIQSVPELHVQAQALANAIHRADWRILKALAAANAAIDIIADQEHTSKLRISTHEE